jgi:hypothetical protein
MFLLQGASTQEVARHRMDSPQGPGGFMAHRSNGTLDVFLARGRKMCSPTREETGKSFVAWRECSNPTSANVGGSRFDSWMGHHYAFGRQLSVKALSGTPLRRGAIRTVAGCLLPPAWFERRERDGESCWN